MRSSGCSGEERIPTDTAAARRRRARAGLPDPEVIQPMMCVQSSECICICILLHALRALVPRLCAPVCACNACLSLHVCLQIGDRRGNGLI